MVRFASTAVGDHGGVRTSHSRSILDAHTVAVLDDRDIAPEALTSRQSPSRLEVMEEGAC